MLRLLRWRRKQLTRMPRCRYPLPTTGKEPTFRKTASELLQHPWIARQRADAPAAADPAEPDPAGLKGKVGAAATLAAAAAIASGKADAAVAAASAAAVVADGAAEVTQGERAAFVESVSNTIRLYAEKQATITLADGSTPRNSSESGIPKPATPGRPPLSARGGPSTAAAPPPAPAPALEVSSDEEDWDADFGVDSEAPRPVMRLSTGDAQAEASVSGSAGIMTNDVGWDDSDDDSMPAANDRSSSKAQSARTLSGAITGAPASLVHFAEAEASDEEWGDVDVGGTGVGADELGAALRRVRDGAGGGAEDADAVWDEGDLVEEALMNSEVEGNARLERRVAALLTRLAQPNAQAAEAVAAGAPATAAVPFYDEEAMLDTCDELLTLLRSRDWRSRARSAQHHSGVLPILDVLPSTAAVAHLSGVGGLGFGFHAGHHAERGGPVAGASERIVASLLCVVNAFIQDDRRLQEALALVGVLPAVVGFGAPNFPDTIRTQAATFVRTVCNSSETALQLFVACGGVQVLVGLLEPTRALARHSDALHRGGSGRAESKATGGVPDAERPSLADDVEDAAAFLRNAALQGVTRIFTLHSVTRNEFCRLLVAAGFLPKAMAALNAVLRPIWRAHDPSREPPAASTIDAAYQDAVRIADLLVLFSHGDSHVRSGMATHDIATAMMRVLQPPLEALWTDERYAGLMVTILKAVKNLSMEPATLEQFQEARAIPTLVPILRRSLGVRAEAAAPPNGAKGDGAGHATGAEAAAAALPYGNEMRNHAMHALFYLCRVNRARQEQAATAGVIPVLKQVVSSPSALKQLALPILCDLSRTGKRARNLMWEADGVRFYLSLLSETTGYWQIHALSAISDWLIADTERVEQVLLLPDSVLSLVDLFHAAQPTTFQSILAPLVAMTDRCRPLATTLAQSGLFVADLVHRLRATKAAIQLKQLLRLLGTLVEAHPRPVELVADFGLYPPVARMATGDTRFTLVRQIARGLLATFDAHLEAATR